MLLFLLIRINSKKCVSQGSIKQASSHVMLLQTSTLKALAQSPIKIDERSPSGGAVRSKNIDQCYIVIRKQEAKLEAKA